ncbi:MAG: transferase [Kangiellaceae bacterium]|nr:transferase [Kangiellaceae bacterium]
MKNICIIGSSGHAGAAIDVIEKEGRYCITGLIDRFREPNEVVHGYPILGSEDNLPELCNSLALYGVFVAIGDNLVRSRVVEYIKNSCPSLPFITAVHPSSSLAKNVTVGDGTIVMSGVSVNAGCTIGESCILNTGASLDHDSTMKDFSSIAPGVVTGGNCVIGQASAICIGATLVHNVHIGDNSIIGAASLVLDSMGPYVIAYGSPAKVIRKRAPDDKYL